MSTHIQFIGTTPQDLIRQIKDEVIPQLKSELSAEFQPKTPNEYVSVADFCKMFGIDRSTEHRWRKEGKFTAYAIGNRVYYLRSEIDEKLKNSKL